MEFRNPLEFPLLTCGIPLTLATLLEVFVRQIYSLDIQIIGAITPNMLRLCRHSPLLHVFVSVAGGKAPTTDPKTCITTWGRRRRPTCTGVRPLQIEITYL